ncbi:nuclear transport factor 2 family protein [Streptomyces sp. enrichment culture]|uniref:nuclear transport factor 2 family protein n=1 Tax=Streptomyces sp. enrichment culture TaxID=1795815 RepID=UPI003F56C985
MTQRVELATVRDRLAVDALVTEYAVAVDDGDWEGFRGLFAPGGRADHRAAGGIEGSAGEVADWLAESLSGFPVRQHLIVNRLVRFGVRELDTGDTAGVRADYISPLGGGARDGGGAAPPDVVCGGRYTFALVRTEDGWRLSEVVVRETWRRLPSPGLPV